MAVHKKDWALHTVASWITIWADGMDKSAPKLQQRGHRGLFFLSLFPLHLYCGATASCSVLANKSLLFGMLTGMVSAAQKQEKFECCMVPPCTHPGLGHQMEEWKELRTAMCKALSCVQGFIYLIWNLFFQNPHLNVSSFGLRALCSASKSNTMSECAADCPLSLFYHLDTELHP